MAMRAASRHALAAAVIAWFVLRSGAAASVANLSIVDYFKLYYGSQVTHPEAGAAEFLRNAAANHESADQVLKPAASRELIVDPRHGYLQIADSSNTDQVLTMAFYTRADGNRLIIAATSDCADACDFAVQFFVPGSGGMKEVARQSVVPPVGSSQFIKPGHPIPKALVGAEPKVNYVPARVGTSLTLKPWYGYEIEEQMDPATRGAIRDVALRWDRAKGAFTAE